LQARADLDAAALGGGRSRVDDDVQGGQFVLAVAERFAREALDAVALDGIARGLDADGEPESRLARFVGTREYEEQRI
jgi:hypothetical protein